MTQKTLVLIKPDGVMKGVSDKIIDRYIQAGLKVVSQDRIRMSQSQAAMFYRDHSGKFYFEGLVLAMTSGDTLAIVLEGENAIEVVRKLNGATDPSKADPGTIRHDFRSAGGPFNTVHGSDNEESYRREVKIVLK